jgi:hypothetical protein
LVTERVMREEAGMQVVGESRAPDETVVEAVGKRSDVDREANRTAYDVRLGLGN